MSNNYISGSLIRKVRTSEDYIELVRQLREVNRIHRNGLDID